jgi:adenosylhomocysteinase
MPDFTLADLARLHPEVAANIPLSRSLKSQIEALFTTDQASILARRAAQMPVLTATSIGVADHPLDGLRTVVVLHFLRDLLYFMGSCQDAGLSPERTVVFYKPYPYMEKEWVKRCLSDWGYHVAAVEDLPKVLPAFLAAGREDVLIIEDGGYAVPFLHRKIPAELGRVRGAVEQTMRGLWNDEELLTETGGLQIPVISIAQSKIKGDFEPAGVADALWRNIQRLTPDALLGGNTVLIIGYGTIGATLARYTPRMPVLVYDKSLYRRALARHEGIETVDTLADALKRSSVRLVIGTSGTTSIDPEHLALVQNGTYLASASSDQIEIAVAHLAEHCTSEEINEGCKKYSFRDGRIVYLLADGYPVNFYGADSVQNQLIDLVMTQMFMSACFLAREGRARPHVIDKETVNKLSANAGLIDLFYRTHWGQR